MFRRWEFAPLPYSSGFLRAAVRVKLIFCILNRSSSCWQHCKLFVITRSFVCMCMGEYSGLSWRPHLRLSPHQTDQMRVNRSTSDQFGKHTPQLCITSLNFSTPPTSKPIKSKTNMNGRTTENWPQTKNVERLHNQENWKEIGERKSYFTKWAQRKPICGLANIGQFCHLH